MAQFDKRHGGAYDRGAADSYYRRAFNPHMFEGKTYMSEKIAEDKMRPDEIAAYRAGYEDNEDAGFFKDYS